MKSYRTGVNVAVVLPPKIQNEALLFEIIVVNNNSKCCNDILLLTLIYRDLFEMASDKHLDAEWKRIQKKTFTRWCNEHLKLKLMKIEDLNNDLSDGVKLIVLLELLSQKKLGRYNKKARIHAQKMENNQLALNFITKTEHIKLVNIGELFCCCYFFQAISFGLMLFWDSMVFMLFGLLVL